MKIVVRSQVAGHYKEVFKAFDRSLFEALSPKGMSMEIVRFDGSNIGDTVHVNIVFPGGLKQEWVSKITESSVDTQQARFVDQGVKLPFFLKTWKHQHIVASAGDESVIIDEIDFRSPFWLMDFFLYPALWLQFRQRRPLYKQYFAERFAATL